MKNQFVGDINDYYKYGLLRILSCLGKKEIGVCWMLTPDRTEYLEDPRKWRDFDPDSSASYGVSFAPETFVGSRKLASCPEPDFTLNRSSLARDAEESTSIKCSANSLAWT